MDLNDRDKEYFISIKSEINDNIYEIDTSQFTDDIIFSVCGLGENSYFNIFTNIENLIGIWYSKSTKKIYIIGNDTDNITNCLKRIERQICYIILTEKRNRYLYDKENSKIDISLEYIEKWYYNYINYNKQYIWNKKHEILTDLNNNNIHLLECILDINKNTDIENYVNLLSKEDN